jgi:hypothetical protein
MIRRWLGATVVWLVGLTLGGAGCGDEFTAAPAAPPGQACLDASDCPGLDTGCQRRSCISGFCNAANEPGGAPCDGGICDGAGECVECLGDEMCPGEVCLQGECVPLECTNGMQDGDESDVDCGGSCPGCLNDQHCDDPFDCQSLFCPNGTCQPCGGPGECPDRTYCSEGVCEDLLPNGSICQEAAVCQSGNCVDGVCCDFDCSGACRSCREVDTGVMNGTCAGTMEGSADPLCMATDPGSCGTTGTCDGNLACAFHESSTECAACVDATTFGTGSCDGMGTCVPNATDSCDPYVCGGDGCLTSCNDDGDCATGFCDLQSMSCLGCGADVPPSGVSCPSQCTGGCNAGVCTIDCNAGGGCPSNTISCPATFDCIVSCDSINACATKTITCPANHTCSVECMADGACTSTSVACGQSGVCELKCGAHPGACTNTSLTCGGNACTATCDDGVVSGTPNVACGMACSCTPC